MPKAKRDAVNLTDLKIRSLKPDHTGEFIQGDTQVPGFGIRVRRTGKPAFVVMKRLPGDTKPTRITLGRVGEMTLQQAREKARDAIAAVRQGVDVNQQKRETHRRLRADRDRVKAGGFARRARSGRLPKPMSKRSASRSPGGARLLAQYVDVCYRHGATDRSASCVAGT